MDAEIQFFMTSKDQKEFLSFAEKLIDSVDNSHSVLKFIIGDCELMFTPSLQEELDLYLGKLEIRFENSEFTDQEQAKTTFRKLRNWIKKNYFSRLAYFNKRNKLTPSRIHWLGPYAKEWKLINPDIHRLKLSKTSKTAFDIGV